LSLRAAADDSQGHYHSRRRERESYFSSHGPLTLQISSEEVENAIYLDDRVAEAAAVPVPHNIMGEEVAVAVSLREGVKATPEDIIAAVHKRCVMFVYSAAVLTPDSDHMHVPSSSGFPTNCSVSSRCR